MTGIVIRDIAPAVSPDDAGAQTDPSPDDKDHRIFRDPPEPIICVAGWLCYGTPERVVRRCSRETCPTWIVCGKRPLYPELIYDNVNGEVILVAFADDMINRLIQHRFDLFRRKERILEHTESEEQRRELEQLQPVSGYEFSLLLQRFPGIEYLYKRGKADEQIRCDNACASELFDERCECENKQLAVNARLKRSWDSAVQEGCSRWYAFDEEHERNWEGTIRFKLNSGVWSP